MYNILVIIMPKVKPQILTNKRFVWEDSQLAWPWVDLQVDKTSYFANVKPKSFMSQLKKDGARNAFGNRR